MKKAQQASLGNRLRRERERRHWTQEQLAAHIGGSVPSINRWEHDRAAPRSDMLKLLSDVFGKTPEQWGSKQIPWNVPFLRNPYFTGREQILHRLHQALAAGQTVALSQIRAISGLGGIGKTQIALEYAYRYADDYEAVLWARADSAETLMADFAALAEVLDVPEKAEAEQYRVVAAVKRWLQDHGPWLLILDNADNLALVSGFLPGRAAGAILLTTRSHLTGPPIKKLVVEKMNREESLHFLLQRIHPAETEGLPTLVAQGTRDAAERLWELMDGLPLALDQAAAYIEETQCSLEDYLELYQHAPLALLRERGGAVADHPDPVATTWSLSFAQIEQRDRAAADLLCLCTCLHADLIAEEIVLKGAAHLGPYLQAAAANHLLWNRTIQTVLHYSLIKRNGDKHLLSIHRLVQRVIRDRMNEQERELWMERTIAALNAVFPEMTNEVMHEAREQCERLLPHVLLCAEASDLQSLSPELASLLRKAAHFAYARADYTQAEAFYLRAVQIREQTSGEEQGELALPLIGLGNVYQKQGKYEQAEATYLRALQIREQAVGPAHADVAYILNDLANIYYLQGRYAQAEPLYQRSVQIKEQALGTEHLQVAYPLTNLAFLYQDQGRYEQAVPLFQRAVRIWEQAFGQAHPHLAYPLNGLAITHALQREYAQAEPLFLRALCIWEQAFGEAHPEVASALTNLGAIYREQGTYEQAEPLLLRALQIREQIYGPEHPDVAPPLNGLANLYRDQGKYEQAEPLYRRTLALRQQGRGPHHLETAESLASFARFYEQRNLPEEALPLALQALAIREEQLGLQHPDTARIRTDLGRLLSMLGQLEAAARLERTVPQTATDEEQV